MPACTTIVMRGAPRAAAGACAPGMRVGIYAPNSYAWLVHDLALIEIGAISVPFTDDFAGQVNEDLLARYDIALLLISKSHAKLFAAQAGACRLHRCRQWRRAARWTACRRRSRCSDDQHSLVFSSGSAGGLKGLVISRKGIEETLPPDLSTPSA